MQRALAAVIAVLLVAGGVGAVVVDDNDDRPVAVTSGQTTVVTSTTTTSVLPATTVATAPPPDELTVLVRQLQGFVERERGLKFTAPVKVSLEPSDRFQARIVALAREDDEDLDKAQKLLRALDLIPQNTDLRKARDELLSAAVVGFYDDERDELVVRGARLSPAVRSTLVHEITHALQDQVFDLHRPELDERDDEAALGLSAVVEGDAVRIQESYERTFTDAEQAEAQREERAASGRVNPFAFPPIMLRLLLFPYSDGARFVQALLQNGGQARIDEATRQPPTTSEQVMHPAAFFRGDGPKPVAQPAADGPAIDEGVMGELVLRELLASELDPERAQRAAAGWGGDRYVAWSSGDRTCLRTSFLMDSDDDRADLSEALRDWAAEKDDARVETGDSLTLTSCG